MSISVIGGADGPTSIFLAGKIGNPFLVPALVILVLFYGIYFVKKFDQKRRGIRTSQLGRGKERTVRMTEIVMTAATVLIVPIELFSILADWSFMPQKIRAAGIAAGILGDIVFLLAVLTMKDSWRAGIPEKDRTSLVSHGIYRYSRNPAFLGFDLMYTGILLMYFNWLSFSFTLWAVIMLHRQILQEEKYLEAVFGDQYLEYKKHTCRYFGRKRFIT